MQRPGRSLKLAHECRLFLVVIIVPCIVAGEYYVNAQRSRGSTPAFGTWKEPQRCPVGMFVTAADVHYDWDKVFFPYDNVGLVGVAMRCSPFLAGDSREDVYVFSQVGGVTSSISDAPPPSNLSQTLRVEEIVYQLPLRSDCTQGSESGLAVGYELSTAERSTDEGSPGHDRLGALNLRLHCSNLRRIAPPFLEAYGGGNGLEQSWSSVGECGTKHAVCGIQTRSVDLNDAEVLDHSAIEDVRLICCALPNPASVESCTPRYEWSLVERCNVVNPAQNGTTARCIYSKVVGVSVASPLTSSEYAAFVRDRALGFDVDIDINNSDLDWLYGALAFNAHEHLEDLDASEGGYVWKSAPDRTWTRATSAEEYYPASPNVVVVVWQLVVRCSYYVARTGRLRVHVGAAAPVYIGI